MWRDLYSFACLVAARRHLDVLSQGRPTQSVAREVTGSTAKRPNPCNTDAAASQQAIAAALHELDMAAIMGGPLFRCEVDQLVTLAQTLHQTRVDMVANLPPAKRAKAVNGGDATSVASSSESHAHKPDAVQGPDASGCLPRPVCVTSFVPDVGEFKGAPCASPQQQQSVCSSQLLPPGSLQPQATHVPADHLPSLERCTLPPCHIHNPATGFRAYFVVHRQANSCLRA